MSEQRARRTFGASTSSVLARLARTSASRGEAPALTANARVCGGKRTASSANAGPVRRSSRTLPMGEAGTCARCGRACTNLATVRPLSSFQRSRPGARTSETAASLWPTPTASRYGSGQNGNPRDGREAYRGRGKPSLDTLARHTGGQINPSWEEALMGFPLGWTDIGGPPPQVSPRRRGSPPSHAHPGRTTRQG
jgi:hypothetical protein